MKSNLIFAGILTTLSASANAADWYDNAALNMGRVEQGANGVIWLVRASGTVEVPGNSSSCIVNAIQLIPPTGKEKDWLAMVLSATIAGKALNVYGDCDQANYRINVNRLVIKY